MTIQNSVVQMELLSPKLQDRSVHGSADGYVNASSIPRVALAAVSTGF
jgi:hypothetical protein